MNNLLIYSLLQKKIIQILKTWHTWNCNNISQVKEQHQNVKFLLLLYKINKENASVLCIYTYFILCSNAYIFWCFAVQRKTLKLFQQNITYQSQYFSTGCFCENCSSGVWKLKIFTLKSTFWIHNHFVCRIHIYKASNEKNRNGCFGAFWYECRGSEFILKQNVCGTLIQSRNS